MLPGTSDFHLAQFNIARLKAPLNDPSMADFLELLRREGPMPRAFTFRDHCTPEEAARAEAERAARTVAAGAD
ncbi:hypothetical protein [Thermomonospora catenispora]|uniref:hypothetical protein n=1 Tax=Thermomonospora catenispora TaxID=2493090 RepID=UPI0019D55165|nr:hypothetical protein [Thermomonospora catenispora]